MHEMGIAVRIVEIACDSLPEGEQDLKIEAINLKVGKMTAIIPSNLRFCFDIAAKESVLEGARLNIEEVPITVKCSDCDADTVIENPLFECGTCGGKNIVVTTGRELIVSSIEVAD
jgi:hydrogenase nickel incorporation protein HypA/HybF